MKFKVAAAQYPVTALSGFDAFAHKLEAWVKDAVSHGANLLVFPEYASLELTSFMPPDVQADIGKQLVELQPLLPDVLEVHANLARAHGVYVLGASYPVRDGNRYVNRAHFFSPSGQVLHQDKIVMTRFEREEWGISGGSSLRVFDTAFGRVGVTICYDVEFPLLCRPLVDHGVDVLLTPSCTEGVTGFHRVRVGARARALENQCYAVQAPLIGEAPWSYALERGTGAAGVFGPIEARFGADGVIAEGTLNEPCWVYADLDLDLLRESKRDGETLNSRDWAETTGFAGVTLEAVKL